MDEFAFEAVDLGIIKKITIGHDGEWSTIVVDLNFY